MKSETLREWLDAEINDYYDGSVFGEKNEFDDMLYADIDKDDPTGPTMWVGIRYLKDYIAKKLGDATVYCECPECGGSRLVPDPETVELGDDGEFHIDDLEMLPCPACADAPTAIVSAALREKARETICRALRKRGGCDIWPEYAEDAPGCDGCGGCEMCGTNVDAVLSTVLGRPVRYASQEIPAGEHYATLNGLKVVFDRDLAILEEAGKEE